ncbi:MAG: rod shape-determining protein MreD [Caenibius sp.]
MTRFETTGPRRSAFGQGISRSPSPVVATVVPHASILVASMLVLLPIIASAPVMPPVGFMMMLAWRLVRPGLLPVWAGALLGAFDDLFSGQPFGFGIMTWSMSMLIVEGIEARFPWRGFFQDWLVSGVIVASYLIVAAFLAGGQHIGAHLVAIVPQLLLSVLMFPIFSLMVSALDRFRLRPIRATS